MEDAQERERNRGVPARQHLPVVLDVQGDVDGNENVEDQGHDLDPGQSFVHPSVLCDDDFLVADRIDESFDFLLGAGIEPMADPHSDKANKPFHTAPS